MKTTFKLNDGGREAAGFRGLTGDYVTRAIAIATGKPYKEVYNDLFELAGKTPRNGVNKKVYKPYIESLGWVWVPTMKIGQGCTVHLCANELPEGRLIIRLSRHLTAMIDGEINDTYDPRRGPEIGWRNGEEYRKEEIRCVYGYWYKHEKSL